MQAHATLVTGSPANSENGCWHFIESEANAPIPFAYSGLSCSYNGSSIVSLPEFAPHIAVPWNSTVGWQGPVYTGGFYAVGAAPGVGNPGGVTPGGKSAPLLSGDITITGTGSTATVSGALSYAASDYSFGDGRGNFGDIYWESLIYTIDEKTVDGATPNAFGGFDYRIASWAYPQLLNAQVGGATFPSEVAAPSPNDGLGTTTPPNYWNDPFDPDNGSPSLINYPDSYGIAPYEYYDHNWDTEVPGQTMAHEENLGTTATGQFGTAATCVDTLTVSASACANAANMLNDPHLDNLLMLISTDSSGAVMSATAFAVRGGDLMSGPAAPLGPNDSFAATVWTLTKSTDLTDSDGDGIANSVDNCVNGANGPVIPDAYGTSQGDFDNDGLANACDPDDDDDGTDDVLDGCPIDPNSTLSSDGDGICDYADNCPTVANGPWLLDPDDEGISQRDSDGDGDGDACDLDDDNDSLPDSDEAIAGTQRLNPDSDFDGVLDGEDQYPLNPTQSGIIGDIDGNGVIGIADLLLMQRALTGQTNLDPAQNHRADIHPVGGNDILDVGDVMALEAELLIQ
ncbi:MAG: dockerin type I repeat-containing protein [Gammaproteobacteria bacterium]